MDAQPAVLISQTELQERVVSLAAELAQALPHGVTVIGLLNGSFIFTADLFRALGSHDLQPEIDFMRLSSYGKGKTSSGDVVMVSEPSDISKRDILIVDDILDTGRSMEYAVNYCTRQGARSITTCVLLDKPDRRVIPITVDFTGFEIPDRFIVGYGTDYGGKYRDLPYIGSID